MSQSELKFTVGFKQLSPDARKAGFGFADDEKKGISPRELRSLLRAAEALAPTVAYPLVPELRIEGPAGRSVVQIKDGRLNFVSWSSAKSRGGNPTADQILDIVAGEEMVDDTTQAVTASPTEMVQSSGAWRWIAGSLLGVVILGSNLYSIWSYRRPPGNLLPPYKVVEADRGGRLLQRVAGIYETGREEGDRRLEINRNGSVVWIKLGPNRTAAERKEFTAQGAESDGKEVLFTSRKSLILVKDATAVVMFGDTYTRAVN
jgi:hypothetical protein